MKALLSILMLWPLALCAGPNGFNGLALSSTTYAAGFLKRLPTLDGFPAGATHYWKFEEADYGPFEDAVGSLDFTDSMAAWAQVTGKNNFGVSMDDSSGPLETAATTLGTAWTIGFWFKGNASCDGQTIVLQNGGAVEFSYVGSTAFRLTVEGVSLFGDTGSSGNWHFVVGTYSGTTLSISVDGGAFDTDTSTFLNGSGTIQIFDTIGNVAFAIDEMFTYDRALTITEVQTMFGPPALFGP